MYLKKLILTKNSGELIREINFHKGLNLILGNADLNSSSNSLGKTTLIRSINFCLAGRVEEFYLDPENKKVENKAVKEFLIQNQVNFELRLCRDLIENNENFDMKISRKITYNIETQKIEIENYIEDNKYSLDEFKEILKLRLFLTNVNRPTFRQLITKFVRRNDEEVTNILKYLGNFVSAAEYTTLRFFLFGFKDPQSIENKLNLEKEYKALSQKNSSLKAIVPEGLNQKIDLLLAELKEKEELRDSYKINDKYELDENELNRVDVEIKKINNLLATLMTDKDTLISRLKKLEENKFLDNPQDIKYIYEEAKLLNTNIQRKFEETITFHNSMLKNEENYLNRRILKLNTSIENFSSERKKLTHHYNQLLQKLSNQGALAEYTKLNEVIAKLTLDLATDQALLSQLESIQKEKDELSKELDSLSKNLSSSIDEFIKINIHIFNTYFSKYSEKLHNEKWYVSFDKDGASYKFDVKAFESNAGSGKKQSLVAAFDIAYMSFIQDPHINLAFPKFATQDKIEIIDIDELDKLADLVLAANGQLITPIIQDKFKNFTNTDFSGKVILTLNPSEKFFKI
ncbi:hypothetical protein OHW83_10540 [Acinetobacter baumannii]|nr:hypothetical protein [Acinetobacter baumannii]